MLRDQNRLEKGKVDKYTRDVKRAVAGRMNRLSKGPFCNYEKNGRFSVFDQTVQVLQNMDAE
jgi:hypothetical protein